MKLLIIFSVIIFFSVSFYWVIPFLAKKLLRYRFFKNIDTIKGLCLTFDDGPDPESTPAILDILDKAGIHATFFLSGERAEKYPDLVSMIIEKGNEIGNHGYKHLHPWFSNPLKSMFDIIKGKQVIEKFAGRKHPLLFRPPYGKFNLLTLLYIIFSRQKVIFWDIDPEDYSLESAESKVGHISRNSQKKSIILLHDGRSEGKHQSDPMMTVDVLRGVIESFKANGIKFVKTSDVI